MNQQFKPKEQSKLVGTWVDSTLRRAFLVWKQQVEPPGWVWEAICKAVNQKAGEEAGLASGTRPRLLQSLRKIFLRSSG